MKPNTDQPWDHRYWKNIPGPFYSTTNNTMSLLASAECPGHLIYDDQCEFVWRQPTSHGEYLKIVRAIDCDEVDSYGRDGDAQWTQEAVIQWWDRRGELRSWAQGLMSRPFRNADRFREGCDDAVDEDQATAYLAFLDEDLEDYLRSYLFRLEHGREPTPGEPLPDLTAPDPADVMDESEFWLMMMFRVSGELRLMRDRRLRYLWCDGFDPVGVENDDQGAWIVGRAWIMGDDDSQYSFRLRIGDPGASRPVHDWSALLPDEHLTAWMGLDRRNRCIELDPLTAITDGDASPD